MIDIENKYRCNGCGACEYICPVKAISMIEDKEGFVYPQIQKEKCINCGACNKICGNDIINKDNLNCYCGYNNSLEVRRKSTSGGIFPLLAKTIIDKGGVVFGVLYDEEMNVSYEYATTLQECNKFVGSKYVSANINNIYSKIKEFLLEDKYVLVVGTPCLINGIKNIFNKYKKLFLCDIICHATPSQKIFKKYIKYLEEKHNDKVENINFRDKTKKWESPKQKIEFKSGKVIYDDIYFRAFSVNAIHKKSCYKCKFCDINRVSDITIGDFWGVQKIIPEMYDKNGISLILVNTDKGKEMFYSIKESISFKEILKDDALKYNHNSPVKPHKNRKLIFDKIDDKEFIKYLVKYVKGPWYIRIIKKLLPKNLKKIIIKKVNVKKKG